MPVGAPSSGSGNDAFPNRVEDQFGEAVQIELGLQIFAVRLDRIQAEIEQPRNVLIGLPLDEELQKLTFARRE